MLDISDKTKKYLEILEQEFNRENFCDFIKDLLNLNSEDIVNGKEQNAGTELYRNYIDKSQLYAKYKDDKKRTIGIIIIKLKNNKNPANARTLQRNFIAHLLNYYELDASITAIYSDTDDTWRLSFVKQELEIEVGKLKTKVSPAKRYSYLFGKDEPNHTAKEQLLELLENNIKKYSVEEIEEKFSVEKVTKDFFEKYKENYLKLKETLEKNDEFISESKRCDFTAEEFTKKLMGQIVFIYFLQKKGWLGVKLVPSKLSINEFDEIYNKQDILGKKILDTYYISYNGGKIVKKELLEKLKENEQELETLSDIFVDTKYDKEWGTGEKRFIRTIFENCKNRNKNFFDDYLEPFFYNGLNHKRKNQYFSVFNCKIPFLNGGLFEPLDNYKWEIAKFNIKNEIFSNDDDDGILDFFDRYNFTMNEEEPLEKDVAVDPEMLGKIFENLLDVKDRKSKGAFYTPREIVHYMCQESLANYLVNKVGVDYKEIKEFIQYGEMIRDVDLKEATKDDYLVGKTIFENIGKVDKALAKIKIADPAVGSGAFPLGMLNEIVKLRDILTSYLLIYNRLNLLDKKYSESLIINTRSIYKIKWNTIRNSIYAVDIENSAVDITKLRLWLSIVVDQVEVPKSGPEPLPNLDCKIMQGNSLVDEYAGIKLIDERFIDELKDRKNVKFNESNGIVKDFKGHKQYISNNQIQFGDGQKKVQIDDLINLKKELYGTNDPNRKKELLYKIYAARKELLRLNFVGTNKEEKLFEIDKTHNKPYFAWMLEFIEVFIENNGFDIVIGNPPYVSAVSNTSNEEQRKEREIIRKLYNELTGAFDLYVAFLLQAIKLSNTTGIYSFIIPNKLLVSDYAKKSINKLKENGLKMVLSLSHINVFDTASVYPIIILGNKNENEYNEYSVEDLQELNKSNFKKRKKLEVLKTLKDFNIKISSGATGFQAKSLIKNISMTKTENNIPFIVSGCVDKYKIDFNNVRYMGTTYEKAYISKDNSIANSKWEFWNNPKIIIAGMTKVVEAVYTDKPVGMGVGIYGIYDFAGYNPYYILAILNSKYISYFLNIEFEEKHLAGGYLAINKSTIEQLPFVQSSKDVEIEIAELAKRLQENDYEDKLRDELREELDKKIYDIYNIDDEEIKKIEEFYSKRDLKNCGWK